MSTETKRKIQAVTIADLKQLFAENPTIRSKLNDLIFMEQERLTERYDSASSWEEICKIQGERLCLKKINSLVSHAT